uniref:Uncharacterized protein n=1 Tax=Arundo donax TaxID=35708 RepID=A0A0A9AYF9_ARUDO
MLSSSLLLSDATRLLLVLNVFNCSFILNMSDYEIFYAGYHCYQFYRWK